MQTEKYPTDSDILRKAEAELNDDPDNTELQERFKDLAIQIGAKNSAAIAALMNRTEK